MVYGDTITERLYFGALEAIITVDRYLTVRIRLLSLYFIFACKRLEARYAKISISRVPRLAFSRLVRYRTIPYGTVPYRRIVIRKVLCGTVPVR